MIPINKIKHLGSLILISVLLLCSGACAMGGQLESAETDPIAVYPKQTPIAVAPPLPEQAVLVYRLFLEIQVPNVGTAAARAEDLAYRHGGYLVSTQSWYVDGRQNTTIVLAVPSVNFEGLRGELRGLGKLVSENLSGELIDSYPRAYTSYSHITLHLRSYAVEPPPVDPDRGWNPAKTFQDAFQVFIKVFGFLADIAIWLLVVVGPFALLFGLGFVLARRLRGRKEPPEAE
jgi:hypothetical protein